MNLFTKRIGLLFAAVVGVGAIAALSIGASFSLFTATQPGASQTFTAGTVSLNSPQTATCTTTVTNMEPGDVGTCDFGVYYGGTLPAYIGAEATATGNLAPELTFTINAAPQTSSTPVVIGNTGAPPVNTSTEYMADVAYTLSISAGNSYQGQSAVVTVTFYAVQCSNNLAGYPGNANESCGSQGPASWVESGVPTSDGNILSSASIYYTASTVTGTTPGSTGFCQYSEPQPTVLLTGGGTASQSSGSGGVGLSITSNGTTYADDGFYVPLGTLGSFTGYTITGTGSAFGTNLWFGGFTWNGGTPNCLDNQPTGIPSGSNYGLGPGSTAGSLTVNSSSSFFMVESPGGTYTLAQLQAGDCAGITSSTPVWVWIGITSPDGSLLNTTITDAATS
jgi:hypothetical protein